MKYIYIDSNQYRHLFSQTKGFSEDVYNLLLLLIDEGKIQLLLPKQTKEEVERGFLRRWPDDEIKDIRNKIKEHKKLQEKIKNDFADFDTHKKLLEEIDKKISQSEKEVKKIYWFFTNKDSEPNKKLKELFNCGDIIEETEIIVNKAKLRHEKDNPPYDRKLGDPLIWESLLTHLIEEKKKESVSDINLIFVANDKDAWGDDQFDKWLENEYKEKVGGKIFYSKRLSDIRAFTAEEQKILEKELSKKVEELKERIKKAELGEAKQNAIVDFISSPSFIKAGERAKKLLEYKELLTVEDYKAIIRGSLSNPQISQSFFTPPYLLELVTGENGYVVKQVESIDNESWRQFLERYDISLERQLDKKQLLENEIDIKKIPF
jgi:hypothetical protein